MSRQNVPSDDGYSAPGHVEFMPTDTGRQAAMYALGFLEGVAARLRDRTSEFSSVLIANDCDTAVRNIRKMLGLPQPDERD